MCLKLAEVELVLNISTKGIRLGSGITALPELGVFNQLALTYNTLLSSQGTDAHQPRAVRPEIRATFQIYPLTPTKSISREGNVWSDSESFGTGLASPFLPRET